jgi:hydroxyethylthiazole kinase-like sugar kinase family protein
MHLHLHMPANLQRRHVMKLAISVGCILSSIIAVMIPGWEAHAAMIATATNLVWVWS